MADVDLGAIVARIQLEATELEQTADIAVAKLQALGEKGSQAQSKLNPLSATLDDVGSRGREAAQGINDLATSTSNLKLDKLDNKLQKLSSSMTEQQQTVSRLGAELDDMASSYIELEKAAGRTGDIDLAKLFPAQTSELDKEIAKLEQLQREIQQTTTEREAAARAAEQAAQKQAQAALDAAQKQELLNQKMADKTATADARLGLDATAMAIRGVSSAAGGTIGQIGHLASEITFLKRTMTSATSAGAAFAAVLSVGIMAAVTIVTTVINAVSEAEKKRQQAFEDGVENLRKYSGELQTLQSNLRVLKDQQSTTNDLATARSNLVSTFPELIVGYTDEGEAILANSEAMERYIKALEEKNRLARQDVIDNGEKTADKYRKEAEEIKVYEKAIAGYKAEIDKLGDTDADIWQKTLWEMDLSYLEENLAKFQKKLVDHSDDTTNYFRASVQEGVKFSDTVSGLILAWDDLDNTQKTVANSYILNVQEKYLTGVITIEQAIAELNALLSDSTAAEEYFNHLTAADAAAAALETAKKAAQELDNAIRGSMSALSDLEGAYTKLHDGQSLTLEQLYDLSQAYPEVAEYIRETGDLTLQKGEILARVYEAEKQIFLQEQELRAEQLRQERESLTTSLEATQDKINAYLKAAAAYGILSAAEASYFSGMLAGTRQEKEEFEKHLAALDEEYNRILALIDSINNTPFAPSSPSGSNPSSTSTRNEALQEELTLLDHRKRMNELTYEQELAWLERIRKAHAKSSDEQRDMEYRIYALKKSHQDDLAGAAQEQASAQVAALNKLGSAVTAALKAQYDIQRKAEEKRINDSINNWQKWEQNTVAAIQGQIDALDKLEQEQESSERRAEYERKKQALKLAAAYENDDYQRKQIQKQLATLEADEQKRLEKETRDAKRSQLHNQITSIQETSQAQQDGLKEQLNAVAENYDKLTSAMNLRAQAQKILMGKSQQELVDYIKSYAPDYDLAGQTLGGRLATGFANKVKDIVSYVDEITEKITLYQNQVAAVATKAANDFELKTGAKTAPSSTKTATVNQTLHFNTPVQSPIATARAVQSTADGLAKLILE